MRVIGVDPGSHITGYGVLDVSATGRLQVLGHGSLKAPRTASVDRRLAFLFKNLCDILEEFQPQCMALEDIFFARDVKSALVLGQARGVMMLAAGLRQIEVVPYQPRRVKLAVSGYGAAGKDQVGRMVMQILNIKEILKPDTADALALAICHAHLSRLPKEMSA